MHIYGSSLGHAQYVTVVQLSDSKADVAATILDMVMLSYVSLAQKEKCLSTTHRKMYISYAVVPIIQ